MTNLSELLRRSARENMGLMDGDYFDSSVFDAQADAVVEYVKQLLDESGGDSDFVVWMLNKNN